MNEDQGIPPLEDRSFWQFYEERRWSREFRSGNVLHGKIPLSSRESKFRTGEVTITKETLKREWPTWTDDERSDFMGSFYTKDVNHSMEIFRYLVSLALPEDRYRFMAMFYFALDSPEAFGVLSEWILAPDTKARRLLFQPLVHMANEIGRNEAVEVLEKVRNRILVAEEFWDKAGSGTVPSELAWEFSECLAALGWLGKGVEVLPLLERLSGAGVHTSDRARELVEAGRSGKWSLT